MGLAAAEGEVGLDEAVKASGYLHAVSQQVNICRYVCVGGCVGGWSGVVEKEKCPPTPPQVLFNFRPFHTPTHPLIRTHSWDTHMYNKLGRGPVPGGARGEPARAARGAGG